MSENVSNINKPTTKLHHCKHTNTHRIQSILHPKSNKQNTKQHLQHASQSSCAFIIDAVVTQVQSLHSTMIVQSSKHKTITRTPTMQTAFCDACKHKQTNAIATTTTAIISFQHHKQKAFILELLCIPSSCHTDIRTYPWTPQWRWGLLVFIDIVNAQRCCLSVRCFPWQLNSTSSSFGKERFAKSRLSVSPCCGIPTQPEHFLGPSPARFPWAELWYSARKLRMWETAFSFRLFWGGCSQAGRRRPAALIAVCRLWVSRWGAMPPANIKQRWNWIQPILLHLIAHSLLTVYHWPFCAWAGPTSPPYHSTKPPKQRNALGQDQFHKASHLLQLAPFLGLWVHHLHSLLQLIELSSYLRAVPAHLCESYLLLIVGHLFSSFLCV